MKHKLYNFFTTDNNSGYKLKEDWLRKNHNDLYEQILPNSKDKEIPFKEKIWLFINDLNDRPKCSVCGSSCKFNRGFKDGYSEYCSSKCANKSEKTKTKKSKTFKRKTEKEKNKINQQRKKTNQKKYGVDNPFKLKEFQDKQKETVFLKYGCDNVFKFSETKEKIKEWNLKKYGVDHPSKNPLEHKKRIEKQKNNAKTKLKNLIFNTFSNKNFYIRINGDVITFNDFCEEHKEFEITKNNFHSRKRISHNICTKCFPINELSSFAEKEIGLFIFKEFGTKPKKIRIESREIDLFLPNEKFGVEYNGLYWHSDRYVDKNDHLNKTKICEKQGIKLIQVFEDEWRDKQEIVKSMIRNKLKLNKIKLYARNTTLKHVETKEAIEFLNVNHIQGGVGSKIKLGLYYNEELVSLMTFGKKRVAMGNKSNNCDEYEMLRFCNKLNHSIVGGASKLLSFFEKTYKPKSIISFADRRYSNGDLYNKIGFKFIGETKPNYFYFEKNKNVRRHRFKFRKDVLVKMGYDPSLSEREIMNQRGFLRIYDCGQLKYQKTYD